MKTLDDICEALAQSLKGKLSSGFKLQINKLPRTINGCMSMIAIRNLNPYKMALIRFEVDNAIQMMIFGTKKSEHQKRLFSLSDPKLIDKIEDELRILGVIQ